MSGVIEVNKQTAYNIAKISKMTWYRHNQGYFFNHITTGGKRFMVMRHVLNFYIAHGWIPDFVDHIDNIPGNDDPSNLRAATKSQNAHNSKVRSDNSSGVKGVSWNKQYSKWYVEVKLHGKKHFGGRFLELADAKRAVENLRKSLHGEFARQK